MSTSLSRRARLLAVLLLLPAAGAAGAVEPVRDDVIHPRRSAPAGSVPAPAGGDSGRLLLLVGVVAAAVGGWLLWQRRRGAGGAGGAERRLAIAESRSLGNRQYLVVADYDGRRFLLGICPGRIDMLAPLDGTPPPERRP